MPDILDTIKAYDIETIHYRTKIPSQSIKALLAREFSQFNKVQFLGFVSIFEREFSLDLSSYKEEYFTALGGAQESTPKIDAFVSTKEPSVHTHRNKIIFIVLALFLIAFFAYKMLIPDMQDTPIALNDSVIIEAKKQLKEVEKQELLIEQEEANTTVDINETVILQSKVTLLPKRRIWIGLIDMQSGKKVQEIIDSAYEINTSKSWLMMFGHSYVDIEFDKELLEFSDNKKLWLFFENDQLRQIDKEEFKEINGGKAW
ncbi:MAG: hypothetical protein U9R50_06420 [Campylobacterota bacterium]|nr:hypothetical protein [Campylobacterota bacterium]